jgi:hypothetical protein
MALAAEPAEPAPLRGAAPAWVLEARGGPDLERGDARTPGAPPGATEAASLTRGMIGVRGEEWGLCACPSRWCSCRAPATHEVAYYRFTVHVCDECYRLLTATWEELLTS